MRQIVQSSSGGPVRLIDVPRPSIGATEVLVRTAVSAMSPGTERAVTALARSSLLSKARARPDLVRQVVAKARSDGLVRTGRAVRSRLDEDLPLGYSAAGIAVEVGEAVAGIAPGQLIATGGAGKANHAEFQAVPGLLCTPVPEGVSTTEAAFATLASVALHGLRLTDVGPGGKVVVIGLGLIGQLGVRLAQASGCDVVGIDVAEALADLASSAGALGLVESESTTKTVVEWSRGRGADAVILAAATPSSSIVMRTPELCRDRANVVVVGDIGLHLDRRPFYERELTLRFARSYGPGRYERSYEDWGVDYPAGLSRWTEGRNQEAVLDLLAARQLAIADLVTHQFDIADAAAAYELVQNRSEPFVGVTFSYPHMPLPDRPIQLRAPQPLAGEPGVGLVGAGAFASAVLLPAIKRAGFSRLVSVASASGLSARRLAEKGGFEKAVSGAEAVIDDPDVDVVIVATPHDSHARLATRALSVGKHVFCEKPLALTTEELDGVQSAWEESAHLLFVGFNRRWSRSVKLVRDHFADGVGPLVIAYRVSAGKLPESHWYHDRRQGGRLLGEACHFIDTCAAIAGSDAVDVRAVGSAQRESLLDDDFIVSLRYPDGSLATITYSSAGHPSTPKECIEVMGRGRSATIADFREVHLDGRAVATDRGDKGHAAELAAFRHQLLHGDSAALASIASTRTTLHAAAALGTIAVLHSGDITASRPAS